MMTRLSPLLAALLLTACAPSDFVESPVVHGHLQQALQRVPPELSRFNFCLTKNEWYATVEFTDGYLISYKLSDGDHPAVKTGDSTKEQRESDYNRDDEMDLGCFGVKQLGVRLSAQGSVIGEVSMWGTLRTYVSERRATFVPFDDSQKSVLAAGAQAIKQAVEAHQAFIPPQNTWGAKL